MTGDSCLARAVALRAAAAVDHADTELIGHRGWEGTGFLCGGGSQAAWLLPISCIIVYNKFKYN